LGISESDVNGNKEKLQNFLFSLFIEKKIHNEQTLSKITLEDVRKIKQKHSSLQSIDSEDVYQFIKGWVHKQQSKKNFRYTHKDSSSKLYSLSFSFSLLLF
jgi:hypothetical protein